ncbi:N-acetylmuramoyl-L-alanine amidase [Georgenia sp. EYE_87]|uniref:N-acetylmuramoyl-L-alanine amidase n=1 Tax=Georgenia sp. EYE_87 TaxID=2853448 RepID=UPI002002A4EB|nr:N-acetylmuramoyl-L-alanine amidase [Georgenia sp. EYE_87]MCK6211687.1 N-acetylmuramoyl-L-alanine amidase [Georgenia sp. EYE_87]
MHARPVRLVAAGILLSTSLVVASTTSATAGAAPEGSETPAGTEASAVAEAPAVEPMVIALTDDDGARTRVATAGLEAPVPAGQFSASSETAVVGTDAVLTQPIPTEEFLVAGLTWEAGQELAADAQIFVRVEEDGVWSEWDETSHEEGMSGAEAAAGTDPFVTGGAQTIQVRITGSASALPDNLAITVLSSEDLQTPASEPAAAGAESTPIPVPTVAPAAPGSSSVIPAGLVGASVAASPVSTAVLPPRPSIISRAGWGADEDKMTWQPTYRALRAAVVHHTAGTNSYTQTQAASVVRGIYQYHAVTRGWGDIGYNFLVDKWGRVYEGRTGSLAAPAGMMPQGAHAAPVNNGTVGISAMGDYTKIAAPTATIDAMTDVLAWQFGRAGIDASTRSGIYSPGTPALVKGVNLPRIFGHMDVSATACPGKDIYGRLAAMRTAVASKTDPPAPAPAPAPAPTPAPTPATSSPTTGLHPIYLNNALTASSDVVFSYGPTSSTIIVGDWDGNGTDTPAARTHQIFAVRNSNTSGPADKTFAYGRPGDVVLVGDWNGDRVDTLAVRRGREYHIKNTVTSGPADKIVYYGKPDDEILVGDWDGNGTDTFAVRRERTLYIKNTMSTGVADRVIAYGRPGDTMLVGDWDGDGEDTIAVRRGDQLMIRNSLTSGVADKTFTYGRTTDRMLVGDWNGDRKDTFGIFR